MFQEEPNGGPIDKTAVPHPCNLLCGCGVRLSELRPPLNDISWSLGEISGHTREMIRRRICPFEAEKWSIA